MHSEKFYRAKDDQTGWPIKEIRGYLVWISSDNLSEKFKFEQLSAKDLAEAMNTDLKTRKPLSPEKSIIYCGPAGDYLDDNLQPILYR